jgi:hypothetical protein
MRHEGCDVRTLIYCFALVCVAVNASCRDSARDRASEPVEAGASSPGFGAAARSIVNPGFKSGEFGWENLRVRDCEYYAPVDGSAYAISESGDRPTKQVTDIIIEAGRSYVLTLWARSVYSDEHTRALRRDSQEGSRYDRGNPARAVATVQLLAGREVLGEASEDVSPRALSGAPEKYASDDGANIWIDGDCRVHFSGNIFYQRLSSDPIKDLWIFAGKSNDDFCMALAPILTPQGLKGVFSTWYDESDDSRISRISIFTTKNSAPKYDWTGGIPVLEHRGSEDPWVIDPHLFYDDKTRKLWMIWGGHHIYVSELNPETGRLLGTESVTFTDHPKGIHRKVLSFASEDILDLPNVPGGWDGDQWSTGYVEGGALFKHNDHYYVFGSYGHLGANYTIRMGRSRSVTGPYRDKRGYDLATFSPEIERYGASFLLGNDGNHLVPGHPHIWEEDGDFYLGYDYRKDISDPDIEFDYMGIRRLYWAGGWPTIWTPVTATFNADNHPESIGKRLGVGFSNSGERGSVAAFDLFNIGVLDCD